MRLPLYQGHFTRSKRHKIITSYTEKQRLDLSTCVLYFRTMKVVTFTRCTSSRCLYNSWLNKRCCLSMHWWTPQMALHTVTAAPKPLGCALWELYYSTTYNTHCGTMPNILWTWLPNIPNNNSIEYVPLPTSVHSTMNQCYNYAAENSIMSTWCYRSTKDAPITPSINLRESRSGISTVCQQQLHNYDCSTVQKTPTSDGRPSAEIVLAQTQNVVINATLQLTHLITK